MKTDLPKESQDIIVQDVPEDIDPFPNDAGSNNTTQITGTDLHLRAPIETANIKENCAQDQIDHEIGKLQTNSTQISEDRLDCSTMSQVNVKDFAYALSDPKHFGIYPSDDEDEDEDEDVDEAPDGDDYSHDGINEKDLNYNENSDYHTQDGINHLQSSMVPHKFANSYSKIPDSSIDTDLQTNEVRNTYGKPTIENGTKLGRQESAYPTEDENNDILHAVALYEFTPENSNELPLSPDQLLIINYECGDGWLVAHDPFTGQTGLVPSEYIRILEIETTEEDCDAEVYSEFAEDAKDAQQFMPEILADDGSYPPEQGITENINKLSI